MIMKTEKIVSRAIVGFLFAQAVLYGGSKPPMPTNPPPCCALGVGTSPAVDRSASVVLASRVGKRSPDRLSEKSSVDLILQRSGNNSSLLAVDRAGSFTSGQETASPLEERTSSPRLSARMRHPVAGLSDSCASTRRRARLGQREIQRLHERRFFQFS